MANLKDAVRAIQAQQGGKQDVLKSWPAFVGNADGTVQGRTADTIQVRYPDKDSVAVEVRAPGGSAGYISGVRIMVGYLAENPTEVVVLSDNDVRTDIDLTSSITYLPLRPHAAQHLWGYSDPVYILFRQVLNLGVYVIEGFSIQVMAGVIPTPGGFAEVAQTTIDLTSHIPGAGARYALISVDSAGNVVVTDGGTVGSVTILTPNDTPDTPAGNYRLAAIRLYAGQTQLTDTLTMTDIHDLRWPPETLATEAAISSADSLAVSAGAAASVADSKAVSDSLLVSTTDSRALSGSVATSQAISAVISRSATELLMEDGVIPPTPLLTDDETDWLYGG